MHAYTADILIVAIGEPEKPVVDGLLSWGLTSREDIADVIGDLIIVRLDSYYGIFYYGIFYRSNFY